MRSGRSGPGMPAGRSVVDAKRGRDTATGAQSGLAPECLSRRTGSDSTDIAALADTWGPRDSSRQNGALCATRRGGHATVGEPLHVGWVRPEGPYPNMCDAANVGLRADAPTQPTPVLPRPHLPRPAHHVLEGGELLDADGAARVQAAGGDADLGAHPELAAVGELGR